MRRHFFDWSLRPRNIIQCALLCSALTSHVSVWAATVDPEQLPNFALNDVLIRLTRSGCFGTCPDYSVDIHGDGRVIYQGFNFVDVVGRHTWQLPTQDVSQLLASLRAKKIWFMQPTYRADITDNPTYTIMIRSGNQTRQIEDYVGQSVGMPPAVTEFENEIDSLSRSNLWLNLSMEAVQRLQSEGFEFNSTAGAELLTRAVSNKNGRDDAALVAVLALGAYDSGGDVGNGLSEKNSLFELALLHKRLPLVDELISRGALLTNGKPDREKINLAFREAIIGGKYALVQKIWGDGSAYQHPSLTFIDIADDGNKVQKVSPVTLLLRHPSYESGEWNGLDIAKWLAHLGCDMRAAAADGSTLLHIAAESGDPLFVKYLLDKGMKATLPGKYGLQPLGSASNEDVALLLLGAGTDFSKMDKAEFRRYAEYNKWARVLSWLDTH